ncbi:MAG: hypothetical protein HYZ44_11570 [Bacteroidetes bacterium]|nr:hypothetical protein [Bacteroidota bacterium]
MKVFAIIIVTWLTILNQAHGQNNQGVFHILTVKENLLSNDNVRLHHIIVPDSGINSITQFDYLYFDQLIDYGFQKKCQNGDTLNVWDTMTIWSMSVVDNFKELEKIINDNNKLVGTTQTDKARLSIYSTSVSGHFCLCYTKADNGRISKLYLPVKDFSLIETRALNIQMKDFDFIWTKYLGRWSN